MKNTNEVTLRGRLLKPLEDAYCWYFERYLSSTIVLCRESGTEDFIPIIVSERILDTKKFPGEGEIVEIKGEFRSYNMCDEETQKNKLILNVFVKDIHIIDESIVDINEIELDGYIVKKPIYRRTPLGREIADILLAVNRTGNKSSYIPIIVWGRNARYAENCLEIGAHLAIKGRIQSRVYLKKNPETGDEKEMTAYEVSCSLIREMEE